jgi:hypothetical protein
MAVKYDFASTAAGSMIPLRGRSRIVAAPAAIAATATAGGNRKRLDRPPAPLASIPRTL